MSEKPVYVTRAHVFHIDPVTKNEWKPSAAQAVPVSIYHDTETGRYRVIAVNGTEALVNSTLVPGTSFTPTSQKFLQWRDPNTKIVYGLGFGSEEEMKVFGEKFNEALAGTLLATEAAAAQAQPAAAKPVSAPAVARKEAQAQPAAAKPTEAAAVPASRAQAPSEPDAGAAAATPSTRDEPAHQPPRQAAGSTASGSTPAGEAAADAHGTGAVQDKDMATLRFQNERLREALKQSSENRAQWEQELQTARNHNARLKTALQDSFKNMEEWKKQLAVWQAEAAKAKARVKEVEEEHLQKGEGALAKQQAMEEDMATKRVEMEALAGRLKESDRDKERLAARNKELEAKVADLEKAKEPGATTIRTFLPLGKALTAGAEFEVLYKQQGAELRTWQEKLANKIAELDDLHSAFGTIVST